MGGRNNACHARKTTAQRALFDGALGPDAPPRPTGPLRGGTYLLEPFALESLVRGTLAFVSTAAGTPTSLHIE